MSSSAGAFDVWHFGAIQCVWADRSGSSLSVVTVDGRIVCRGEASASQAEEVAAEGSQEAGAAGRSAAGAGARLRAGGRARCAAAAKVFEDEEDHARCLLLTGGKRSGGWCCMCAVAHVGGLGAEAARDTVCYQPTPPLDWKLDVRASFVVGLLLLSSPCCPFVCADCYRAHCAHTRRLRCPVRRGSHCSKRWTRPRHRSPTCPLPCPCMAGAAITNRSVPCV